MNRKKVGYDWEAELVKKFTSNEWKAIRLGAPSVHLPDVVAVNNKRSAIIAMEAKSSSMGIIKVREEQLQRLVEFLGTFSIYRTKLPVLAIRFMRGGGKGREVRFYIVKALNSKWLTVTRDRYPDDALISTTIEYLLNAGVDS